MRVVVDIPGPDEPGWSDPHWREEEERRYPFYWSWDTCLRGTERCVTLDGEIEVLEILDG